MRLTVFLMLEAAPSWLALSRAERDRIAGEALGGLGVRLRHFDAEAFHARISDVAMIEADDPADYYFAIERLRDSPLIASGHFRVAEIVPAYEDGFRQFEAAERSDAV